MFVKVNLASNYSVGTIVSFDPNQNAWSSSTGQDYFGVIVRDPINVDGVWLARVTFSGSCYALSAGNIPDEGGHFKVENGLVVATTDNNYNGVIAPNAYNSPSRIAGDLILVSIK